MPKDKQINNSNEIIVLNECFFIFTSLKQLIYYSTFRALLYHQLIANLLPLMVVLSENQLKQ
jgi:hypothetical protein